MIIILFIILVKFKIIKFKLLFNEEMPKKTNTKTIIYFLIITYR